MSDKERFYEAIRDNEYAEFTLSDGVLITRRERGGKFKPRVRPAFGQEPFDGHPSPGWQVSVKQDIENDLGLPVLGAAWDSDKRLYEIYAENPWSAPPCQKCSSTHTHTAEITGHDSGVGPGAYLCDDCGNWVWA